MGTRKPSGRQREGRRKEERKTTAGHHFLVDVGIELGGPAFQTRVLLEAVHPFTVSARSTTEVYEEGRLPPQTYLSTQGAGKGV